MHAHPAPSTPAAARPDAATGPNLFLVGAPKCGTTSLYEYLRVHPQIYFPHDPNPAPGTAGVGYWSSKEPAFFCTDLDLTLDNPVRGPRQYLNLYADAGDSSWRGDASAFYLYSEVAAERIHAFCPEARILIALRPPLEQMRSLHNHLVRVSQEKEPVFHTAIRLGETGRHRSDLLARRTAGVVDYFGIAHYAVQVERYLQQFGRSRVKVLLLEDLARHPAETYRSILDFLGVDIAFTPMFRIHNGRGAESGVEALLYGVHSMPGVRQAADLLFPYRIRRRVVDALRSRRKSAIPQADPRDTALRERCRPDIERLATMIGRDLSHWA